MQGLMVTQQVGPVCLDQTLGQLPVWPERGGAPQIRNGRRGPRQTVDAPCEDRGPIHKVNTRKEHLQAVGIFRVGSLTVYSHDIFSPWFVVIG